MVCSMAKLGHSPVFTLLLILIFTGFVACNEWSNAILENFEDGDKVHETWFTNSDQSHFRIVNGSHGHKHMAPNIDATTGTAKGKYTLANSDERNNTRWLYSSCFPPSGPGCTLNFSAVIELGENEEFVVCAMKQCHSCQTIHYSHDCVRMYNHTDSWTELSLPIASIPTPFDISFGVSFLHPGSFLALDDIKLVDCDRGYVPEIICSHNEFQCDFTHKCLSRDRLCDLRPDCECGEDEEVECEYVPKEGRFDLRDCDFYSGNCLWYDQRQNGRELTSGDQRLDFRWRVSGSQINAEGNENFGTDDYGSSGFEKRNDTFLSVNLPPHDPPHAAFLRSVVFQPRFSTEDYCQMRFQYQMTNATLQVHVLARNGDEISTTKLWPLSDEYLHGVTVEDQWYRAVVDINSEPILTHYVVQLTATGSSDFFPGHVAVQRLTLDRDCFSPDVVLTSCGNLGPKGPSRGQCHGLHHNSAPVQVIEGGHDEGVQVWTVPETGVYRIEALGSRGGLGLHARDLVKNTRGAKVKAKFNLTKGEKIYTLVGQPGMEACPPESWVVFPAFCGLNVTFVGGGGGGGGGATLIYTRDKSGNPKILLVAGGGGGLPYNLQAADTETADTRLSGFPEESEMTHDEAVRLLTNKFGGRSGCRDSINQMTFWGGNGGFGAGGGACTSGGHGGGAVETKTSRGLSHVRVGSPGRSYVHSSSLIASIQPDYNHDAGRVEITWEWHCPCAYHCIWLDDKLEKPTCVCPQGHDLQPDGITCSGFDDVTATAIPDTSHMDMLPVYIGIGVVCLLVMTACICLYIKRLTIRNRAPHSMKKMSSLICPCMTLNRRSQVFGTHVLPQIARAPAVMHENPHYNLVTTSDTGLNEVNRKHLRLISELGQGAFGQVFYGQLSHVPTVGELPVAVKTLPAFCTEQTEMDFLLEAVIVSKFNHPNIVQFIGVCFEQHPHFLILELLEGGDLKTFLRHARPKWDQPSTLTILDLLRLALDVARGCQHLEEKHFIHRDIAARNCLLTTKGPNRIAKIADFGMARDIYRSDYYKKAGKAMLPVKWMPPEAFLDGLFTAKTDVWSYGILLWEVFSLGHVPYPGCSNEEVMNLVTKGGRLDPPSGCPSAIFDVMMSCWAGMAESRPTFALIISILERTIQDDETLTKGLPVCYVPPPIHPAGVRIRDFSLSPRPITMPSIGATCAGHRSQRLRTHAEIDHEHGYLEPLLANTDSSAPLPRTAFSSSSASPLEPKISQNVAPPAPGHLWDRDRTSKATSGRVPKVFYRPGTCDVTIENQSGNGSHGLATGSTNSKTGSKVPYEKGEE